MEMETILIWLFVRATAVAIAVQRLAVPYTVALVFSPGLCSLLSIALVTGRVVTVGGLAFDFIY